MGYCVNMQNKDLLKILLKIDPEAYLTIQYNVKGIPYETRQAILAGVLRTETPNVICFSDDMENKSKYQKEVT